MTTILRIDASARYQASVSRGLTRKLARRLAGMEGTIIERDLNQGMQFISESSLGAVAISPENRSQEEQLLASFADTLIEELQQADILVLGLPIYNFGPPSCFKAWADLVARAGTTFQYSANGPIGLLENKKAYVVAVSGGTPVGGSMDYMTPWTTFFLGFLGINDVTIVSADGVMGSDGQEKIQSAYDTISSIAV